MNEWSIAIDLGGTDIKAALVDRQGEVRDERTVPTGADLSPAAVVTRLVEVVNAARAGAGGVPLVGVGIGCPGGIYPQSRQVSQSPNFPGWRDVDLIGPLAARTGLPAVIDNDANVAAFGEFTHGAGHDVESMILATLGTGVGGGVILNGRIWRGEWGMAGEIGHVTVEPHGRLCGCGNHGCVEQYASGPGMVRTAREAMAQGRGEAIVARVGGDLERVTPKVLYEAAKGGDALALAVFEQAARYLGMMFASLLNVLNVPLFVVGGGVGAAFDLLIDPLYDEVRRRSWRIPGENVRIKQATLGNRAGVIGAGMLAFMELATNREGTST